MRGIIQTRSSPGKTRGPRRRRLIVSSSTAPPRVGGVLGIDAGVDPVAASAQRRDVAKELTSAPDGSFPRTGRCWGYPASPLPVRSGGPDKVSERPQ